MTENTTGIPLTPREFLSAAKDLLGKTWMVKSFSIGERTIERWIAKRGYVDEDSIRENPIEKYERLLERLADEPGGLDIAVASVDRLAAIVGCELVCAARALPDKPTLEAECLDDYPALTELHTALRKGAPPGTIRLRKRDAINEIEQTVSAYMLNDGVS